MTQPLSYLAREACPTPCPPKPCPTKCPPKPCPPKCPPKPCPPKPCAPVVDPCDPCAPKTHTKHHGGYGGYIAWAILWFIIIAVIIWLILLAVKPEWILKKDSYGKCIDEVDNGKAFLWAIVIAFVIIVIIGILAALAGWGNRSQHHSY